MHYPPASNTSGPIVLGRLGLTAEALIGDRHSLRFELRREAGTFVCRGTAGDGRGSGTFRFRPDSLYANALITSGMPALTLREHVKAAMFDVSSFLARAIVANGPSHVTVSNLISLKMFRIAPELFGALQAKFPAERFDELLALAMAGVTPAYVESLRRLDVRDITALNVSAMRASGVDQAFIDDLAAKDHRGLSIDEVARLHSAGS